MQTLKDSLQYNSISEALINESEKKINALNITDKQLLDFYRFSFNVYTDQFDLENLLTLAGKTKKLGANYKPAETIYYGMLGSYYDRSRNPDSSIYYFKKALNLAQEQKDSNRIIQYKNHIGAVYFTSDDWTNCYKWSIEAYQQAKEWDKSDSTLFKPLYNASLAMIRMANLEKATALLEDARILSANTEYHIHVLNSLGVIYRQLKEYTKAKAILEEAAQNTTQANVLSIININLGAIELEQENLDKALAYFNKAKNIKNLLYLPMLYNNIAVIYKLKNQYDSAIFYIEKGLAIAKENKLETSSYYVNLYEIYELKADYETAFELSKKVSLMKDSLYDLEKTQQYNKLVAEFETREKEAEIERLETLDAVNKQRIDTEKKYKNYILYSAIIAILLVALSTITFYKLRLRSLKLKLSQLNMDVYSGQLRPHFIYNVLGSIQAFIAEDKGMKAINYISDFAGLMRANLESLSRHFIPLTNEIKLINEYIRLEQLRIEQAFTYEIKIDESVNDENLFPTMILQPLVENALKHGILKKEVISEGHLLIAIKKKDKQWICKIKDNGPGFMQSKEKDHVSRGTTILKQRVKLLSKIYTKGFSLDWSKEDKEGVTIVFKAPTDINDVVNDEKN